MSRGEQKVGLPKESPLNLPLTMYRPMLWHSWSSSLPILLVWGSEGEEGLWCFGEIFGQIYGRYRYQGLSLDGSLCGYWGPHRTAQFPGPEICRSGCGGWGMFPRCSWESRWGEYIPYIEINLCLCRIYFLIFLSKMLFPNLLLLYVLIFLICAKL